MGHMVEIQAADGSGSFQAYLALPTSGKGPGIVLAQEIFGVNPYIRDIADHYAELGYVVLAPDLFWRQQPGINLAYTPADWEKAFSLFKGFNQDKGVEDISSTLQHLHSLPEFSGKTGVLGFCLGGKLAYLAACRCDVDVAVGYYGVGIDEKLAEAGNIKGRLVLHFAELDGYCGAEAREKILAALGQGKDNELYVYANVDHAFSRPASEHFDKAASELAYQRSVAAFSALKQ